ncbi:MAG: FAD-binding protein [Ardenticatenaceae bacterium]|nr:FAD-binding protein [Anaerolineales bacterium]MCB8921297.1 FAD-binding protein [Ardenticatenaceae bacterium]MCB8990663.1 FAD-binding protein [Ardenticatenaceae bacterium]
MTPFSPVTPAVLQQLEEIVGAGNVSVTEADRRLHAQDMSRFAPRLAEVVVWPETAVQIAAVLALANEHHIPVTPWGAGSSLEGHPIPWFGGISLSTERMTAVLALHTDDFQVTVQPGIGYKDLNAHLARYGLFFPPDPGANATIGGMLANNAAGIRTVKYGATKDNVLRMEVALADGRLIHVGSRSIKQSAGYDLLHLFVGSEGTLGVVTEATLKLTPIPELMSAVMASFPAIGPAIDAVVAVRGSGLDVAALEFVDAQTAVLLARENGLDLPAQPTLLMEFHAAHAETIHLGLETVHEICAEFGATRIHTTADPTERQRLWNARHHTYETWVRARPDVQWLVTDVAVPISAYPQLIARAEGLLAAHDLAGFMIGHAGDGNMHVTVGFRNEEEEVQANEVNKELVLKAIALGGTCTGEHGVGVGKVPYLRQEHGAAMDVMRSLKHTLDPNGILNPGKVFETAVSP